MQVVRHFDPFAPVLKAERLLKRRKYSREVPIVVLELLDSCTLLFSPCNPQLLFPQVRDLLGVLVYHRHPGREPGVVINQLLA